MPWWYVRVSGLFVVRHGVSAPPRYKVKLTTRNPYVAPQATEALALLVGQDF